jgi:methionyl-tRNA formyltransferase
MDAFDTIVLLTGEVEQPVLSSILLGHNPRLTIRAAETSADIAALEPKLLRHARLVAFSTSVIVPAEVLNRLGYSAYNFHPGPPHFPGWAPARFAIHRHATEFGATAHVMTKRVDAGPIVGVEMFSIPAGMSVNGLEELSYAHLAQLFRRLAKSIATEIKPLPELPISWGGQKTSRHLYAAMDNASREVLEAK